MSDNPMPTIDQMLCFAVYSAGHAFTRFYKPRLDALDLTYPQYLVFLVLWEKDDLTVKALGDRLFLDSGTITPLIKRLEARGLVERRRDEDDERRAADERDQPGHEPGRHGARAPGATGPAGGAASEHVGTHVRGCPPRSSSR